MIQSSVGGRSGKSHQRKLVDCSYSTYSTYSTRDSRFEILPSEAGGSFKDCLLRFLSFIFIACLLIATSVQCNAQVQPSRRVIAATYSQVKGKHNAFFANVVGAGRAAEGLRADWQRDLAIVHDQCGFKYIRFHGLLQDEMGVYSEDKQGNPVYNFQYVDSLYDSILKIGMKPFVEFGFMPQTLASGSKTVFWWKGNITPPKDYEKWARLIRVLVEHWTQRYGSEEVKR